MVCGLLQTLKKATASLVKMRDCFALENLFEADSDFINPDEIRMDLGKGRVEIDVAAKEGLFYRVLSEESGENIADDLTLMKYVQTVAGLRKNYERVGEALAEADKSGSGIVHPDECDYTLEKPQLVKKGAGYGVQFKANATSYHIMKVEVTGAISPTG